MVSRTRRTDGDRPRGAGGEVRGKKQKKKQNVSKKTSRLTDEFVVVDSGLGLAADVPRVDHVSGVVVVVVLALQRQFLQRRSHFGAVDAAARRTTVRKIGKELEKKKKKTTRESTTRLASSAKSLNVVCGAVRDCTLAGEHDARYRCCPDR